MEFDKVGEENLEPVSPSSQYSKSSVLSVTIQAVLELEFPIDDSFAIHLMVRDIFLPTNPRFSSIMVTNKRGVKNWKKVEVKVEEHIHFPSFPSDMSTDYYDECFNEYLSSLAAEQLSSDRPLWEIHVVKYPTKHAAGNMIFKFHQSLGDGYSLMGALLSCLRRTDNPSIPLTFPSRQSSQHSSGHSNNNNDVGFFKSSFPKLFSGIVHSVHDFGWSVLKSRLIEDDKSPIRSGEPGVEFRPVVTATTMFSIGQVNQIKSRLKVTINDVLMGIITYGTRLYMEKTCEHSGTAESTGLVLFNTRAIGGYKSVSEMLKPDAEMPWGNRTTFLHVPIPKLTTHSNNNNNNNDDDDDNDNSILKFVQTSHELIKRQRNSPTVYLTAQLLSLITKTSGPETTSQYIRGTIENTSMTISNLIGPVEPMSFPTGQPVKGLYFSAGGRPQSLTVTMISYVDKIRIAINGEKGFIDSNKLKSCIECAFDTLYREALDSTKSP